MNVHATNSQPSPAVASDANGNFLVAWQSFGQDGSSFGVFGRRYDAAGNAQGGEFQVNALTTQNQVSPSVASSANGRFVVAWHSRTPPAGEYDVFGKAYDAAGTPGGEFRVNSYTTGNQTTTSVASDASGKLVVV